MNLSKNVHTHSSVQTTESENCLHQSTWQTFLGRQSALKQQGCHLIQLK